MRGAASKRQSNSMNRTTDENGLRLHLLGELSEAEQAQLEQRLMTDPDFFAQLEVAEDELADDYVRGKLTPAENAKVSRDWKDPALHLTRIRGIYRRMTAPPNHGAHDVALPGPDRTSDSDFTGPL